MGGTSGLTLTPPSLSSYLELLGAELLAQLFGAEQHVIKGVMILSVHWVALHLLLDDPFHVAVQNLAGLHPLEPRHQNRPQVGQRKAQNKPTNQRVQAALCPAPFYVQFHL